MVLGEYFRVDYEENMSTGKGPLPPGLGRGFWFKPDLFWPMPDFLTDKGLGLFRSKASFLLNSVGIRKDFHMPQSGGTARNMRVVPGTALNKDPELAHLYNHPELLSFLSGVIDAGVVTYPDPLENIVITSLERKGDTHGQHLDVPSIAVVMCLEAPPIDRPEKRVEIRDADGEVWQRVIGTDDIGGMLSFVNVHGDQQVYPMAPGDAYLLRSDLIPHAVLPLSSDRVSRTILNFTYGIEGQEYLQDGSAAALFTTAMAEAADF